MWYLLLLSLLMFFFNNSVSFFYHTPTDRYPGVLPNKPYRKSFESTYQEAALRALQKNDLQLCELIKKIPNDIISGNNVNSQQPYLYQYIKTSQKYFQVKASDRKKDHIYTKYITNRGWLASTITTSYYLRGLEKPFYTQDNGYVSIIEPYSRYIGNNDYFAAAGKIFKKRVS